MGRFDRQTATAKRLIALNGQQVTWRQAVPNAGDPNQPWKPGAPGAADHTVSMVFLPLNTRGLEALAAIVGTEIPKGNAQGYMAGGLDFVPSIKDVVIRGTDTLSITSIDTLAPNGQVILYTVNFAV